MMLLSQVLGLSVISAEDALPAGEVAGLGIDPLACRVSELYLKSTGSGDSVPWAQVRGMGPDAVIVDTAAAEAGRESPHSRAHKRLLGKRILTEFGEDIGTLTEVTFDPETGAVGDLYIGRDPTPVPGSRMVGLGSYALVLAAG
ncbi:hypothetical protein GCM10010277_57490 [Streptomyces longisporoflavus]|uniref:PRC-barrel domain-containing protein n=1 Tax=Streptomyces longisporoflavus TaxID=28044 RepID=UPI00167D8005|nr:PRC-barrel domain-containing protein [Streptomyces longisporoflavus]GGV56295.1 hypothetical protein GCM10010277_57490 [Streptomyces longisporoflavus]